MRGEFDANFTLKKHRIRHAGEARPFILNPQ